jgi:hypothetical protein
MSPDRRTSRSARSIRAATPAPGAVKKEAVRGGIICALMVSILALATIAHADGSQERLACEFMDERTGPELGYTPVTYAFMMLRVNENSLSTRDAGRIVYDATHVYCPTHVKDLPSSWHDERP